MMPMRVDEAGHADHTLAVDHMRARRVHICRHRDNCAVAHVHIAARQVADRIIHRQNVRAAHHKFSVCG